ncbi:MAG TPA: hypothetical protein VFM49_19405 [Chloroflexia bacterium]|nr:hypothetical protein [Chloroflexia bacterium]
MEARDALEQFTAFSTARGVALDCLSPQAAVDLMARFYAEVRADDCAFDADGDMLLFQWGIHNWGDGEFFRYGITRQFIPTWSPQLEEEESDEGWIGQLSLTLKYHSSAALKTVGSGNRWCAHPLDLPEFLAFIQTCAATTEVSDLQATATELRFNNAE